MNKKIRDNLYTARWGITEALEKGDFTKLDHSADMIAQAKADLITIDIDEPERPDQGPKDFKYEVPKIVVVPGVRFKTHGNYRTNSGNAKGLVVHYTVSGRTPKSAKSVLNYLAKKGLGCMVMDNEGTIYVPENFNLQKDVAWHAGSSSWKGKSGISRYCMGMEICCWGSAVKNASGTIREVAQKDNVKAGKYEAYTVEQENALFSFILWQLDVNPDFDLEWLVGHDEVAPKRKSDPGGSLSMTMPELRAHIKSLMQ